MYCKTEMDKNQNLFNFCFYYPNMNYTTYYLANQTSILEYQCYNTTTCDLNSINCIEIIYNFGNCISTSAINSTMGGVSSFKCLSKINFGLHYEFSFINIFIFLLVLLLLHL